MGYTPEECIRQSNFFQEFIHPSDIDELLKQMRELQKTRDHISGD